MFFNSLENDFHVPRSSVSRGSAARLPARWPPGDTRRCCGLCVAVTPVGLWEALCRGFLCGRVSLAWPLRPSPAPTAGPVWVVCIQGCRQECGPLSRKQVQKFSLPLSVNLSWRVLLLFNVMPSTERLKTSNVCCKSHCSSPLCSTRVPRTCESVWRVRHKTQIPEMTPSVLCRNVHLARTKIGAHAAVLVHVWVPRPALRTGTGCRVTFLLRLGLWPGSSGREPWPSAGCRPTV